MIKAKDAIDKARSLIGTPYSELDCINLIKKVIREAPGGVKGYTTAGTNSLWRSFDMSAKYKDLTERHDGIDNVPAGAIPFKRDGADYHHAGIATDRGTVIHSSSTQGGRGVVETPLTASEGWNCWGVHRYIRTSSNSENNSENNEQESEEETVTAYKMQVTLSDQTSTVNVRKGPSTKYDIIGRLGHGAVVTVQAEADGWVYVTYGDSGSGYISTDYLTLYNEPENIISVSADVTIIDSEGNRFKPVGDWRVLIGSID